MVFFKKVSFLTDHELECLRQAVLRTVSESGFLVSTWQDLIDAPREKVQEIVHNKHLRFLTGRNAALVTEVEWVRRLLLKFPDAHVVNAIDPRTGRIDQAEIYFRLVTPGEGGNRHDVHIDEWYDEIYQVERSKRATVKIWVALQTEPGKNGLLVRAINGGEDIGFSVSKTLNGLRPRPVSDFDLSQFTYPEVAPGEAIAFDSSKVLHVGALNLSKHNRISVEISLSNISITDIWSNM